MKTYISILRGINVSGQKKVPMVQLKKLYEDLKFKDVITYIQSGNVIFKADGKTAIPALTKKIEKKIEEVFGFQVPILIKSLEEIEHVLKTNPFLKEKGIDMERLYVTFLAEAPTKANLEIVNKFEHPLDRFIISGKDVFLYCPGGYGETKLSNNFFENKLKVTATTRNWKTVNKLAELAK